MASINLSVNIKRTLELKPDRLRAFATATLCLIGASAFVLLSTIQWTLPFSHAPNTSCQHTPGTFWNLGRFSFKTRSQSAHLAYPFQGSKAARDLPLMWYAERMSVEHYTFLGQIPGFNQSGANATVEIIPPSDTVLHLFVKCVLQPSGSEVLCRGWGFAENLGTVPIEHRHIAQPAMGGDWRPRIEIRTGAPGEGLLVYPLTFAGDSYVQPEIRPFHFEGELPLSLRDQVPEIRIDDWPRFHYFRNLESPEPGPPVAPSNKTLLLLSSFYYEPPGGSYALAAQLLVHHLRHHLAMGLTGEIVYVQHHYAKELLKNPELIEFVRKGQLQLVVWDAFPKYDTPGFPTTDQPLQYSHGLLENWGRGVRILVADVDEFLAMSQPGDIGSALACAGWADQVRLRRFDVMCSGVRCPGDGQSDIELWRSPEKHPLRHYALMDRSAMSTFFGRLPKVIVSPENVRHFYVHEGVVAPGGTDVEMPEECAFLVHVLCLYSKRSDRANFRVDKSWHWFFQDRDSS